MPESSEPSKILGVPNESISTTDFLLAANKRELADMDLQTPTSLKRVLTKAEIFPMETVFDGDGTQLSAFAGIGSFRGIFELNLGWGPEIKTTQTITGETLFQAYKKAVMLVSDNTTSQFAHGMLSPEAVGRFLDYFGVPVRPEVIAGVKDPTLAAKYTEQARQWAAVDGK